MTGAGSMVLHMVPLWPQTVTTADWAAGAHRLVLTQTFSTNIFSECVSSLQKGSQRQSHVASDVSQFQVNLSLEEPAWSKQHSEHKAES